MAHGLIDLYQPMQKTMMGPWPRWVKLTFIIVWPGKAGYKSNDCLRVLGEDIGDIAIDYFCKVPHDARDFFLW